MTSREFAGKRVVVMGLGHFGGGIGAARWLAEQGAAVTVTDKKSETELADSVRQLAGLPITFHLGGHDHTDLDRCDLLVVSPAVPKDRSEFVADAIKRSISISSELNLFVERCRARCIVGVTGSAGKSTTTAMIGSILEAAENVGVVPKAWVGGNIGRSLLADLNTIRPDHLLVLELSSFQLEDLALLRWSPHHAIITNIRPNHLDRHGTMEAYTQAKLNIVRYQNDDGRIYIHADDSELASTVAAVVPSQCIERFRFQPDFAESLQVPGRHNRDNAAAAIAVARALGVPDEIIRRGLRAFRGLEHRLEFVAEVRGVRYYNDSKSTTPESTLIALDAFEQPVVMLIGGADKGMSFDAMCETLAKKAKAVICYGAMGDVLAALVARFVPNASQSVKVERVATVQDAVACASGLTVPGDVVVLSPACTSYDQFGNFEERGEAFRRAARSL